MEMDFLPGRPRSLWIATSHETNYPRLTGRLKVDVCIIGAGIAGLTAAYLLREGGFSVAVLDSKRILTGVTGHTTAKITLAHGLIYRHLISKLGQDRARLYAEANAYGLQRINQLVEMNRIDCGLSPARMYIYTESKEGIDEIQAEAEAARSLGLNARFMETVPLPYETAGAAVYEDQARFHPRKYLLALAELASGSRNVIYENTMALDVREGNPCEVIAEGARVLANDVIVTTNLPFMHRGMFYAKAFPIRSYVLAMRVGDRVYPDTMFYSAGNPAHSLRFQETPDGLYALCGGGDHKTGQGGDTAKRYLELERFFAGRFKVGSIDYRWSTQDYDSMDRMPFIGPVTSRSKHVYIATGFGGWGMTAGTLAGAMLTDEIMGLENRYSTIFSPARFELGIGGREFISENANVAR
ncbi:MAG TPA: FAD-binding oxidoreductase, partial [Nitrospirota bacterium]